VSFDRTPSPCGRIRFCGLLLLGDANRYKVVGLGHVH
jgi:hypothetical protein